MSKQDMIAYLKENKDRFPREALLSELRKSGYSETEINEAAKEVYSPQVQNPQTKTVSPNINLSDIVKNGIAGKTLSWYWQIIKLPFLILVAWLVLIFLLSRIPVFGGFVAIMNDIFFWIITLAAAIYVGYIAVKKFSANLNQSIVSGALGGVLIGLLIGIISLITYGIQGSAVGGAFGWFGIIGWPISEGIYWIIVCAIVYFVLRNQKTKA